MKGQFLVVLSRLRQTDYVAQAVLKLGVIPLSLNAGITIM